MIIRKIRMVNFRGFRDKTIDFDNKPVVLLSAANGIGKTTTIDAIEWCLTGEIKRLKTAFDSRSTNDSDRKMNSSGILKNKDAGKKDKIKVVLYLYNDEKEIILCREQTKDEFDYEGSILTIENYKCKENYKCAAKEFIHEYIGDSFYNYHFCDVQKSFNVQSQKRKGLKDLFSEFITNYDNQKQIAENLDLFAEDVDRYCEEKNDQKVKPEIISDLKKRLENARDEAKQVPYPEVTFYPEEKTKIVCLTKDELNRQKSKIEKCGYYIALSDLSQIVENEALKSRKSIIKKISLFWEKQEESIHRAVKAGFWNNTDAINGLEKKYSELKSMSLIKDTILREGEFIFALEKGGYTESDFFGDKKVIIEQENKVKSLSDEIELLSQNNKMLRLLSSLTANKRVLVEYRDTVLSEKGVVRCPVCGSDTFAGMDEALILKEADDYIKKNGDAVKLKEFEKSSLQEGIDRLYQRVIDQAKNVVNKEKIKLEAEIKDLKELNTRIQPYFDLVKKLSESIGTVNIEQLTEEKVEELLADVEAKLLEYPKEKELNNSYKQILTVLGYDFENESVQQTYAKIKNIAIDITQVSNFTYDAFVSKINAIDQILANHTIAELNQKLEKYNRKNNELETDIKELQKLKEVAVQRARDIRCIVDELSKIEYEKVGPALSKFYNKLARFNSNDGIRVIQENEGISLVDDNNKNIVNILSNGQISVFMLAHFFAGINVRNAQEKMKVFFIDDLTACMDDVNMLAFMDLLKYQMTTKATMEQLFFITCDDRISRLLKYKMSGRGIKIRELVEADFVETRS